MAHELNSENEFDNFHLSGNSPQQSNLSNLLNTPQTSQTQSIEKRPRPLTPPNLSKNQAKKWRKNWEFEEKKRIKKLKQQKQQKQTTKEEHKTKENNKNNKQLKIKNVHRTLPQYDNPHTLKKNKKQALVERIPLDKCKQISMFAHLAQNEKYLIDISAEIKSIIHPVILRAGLYYNYGIAWGANTRCIIMLNAFKTLINDCDYPNNNPRELLICLNQSIQFLNDCRLLSVSMGNTIRWIKKCIIEKNKNKIDIINDICNYVYRIETADKMISSELCDRICDNDIILTYARSYVVEKSIINAYTENKKRFSVIIIDGRPHLEGKYLLNNLSAACPDLEIHYALINSLSYIMSNNNSKPTKVILGAACIMSNGSVVSRNGTSIIALCAQYYKIPVMVCCETYKFSQRVQIDSICMNELGDFDALINKSDTNPLKNWRQIQKLKMLNLKYDTTPSKLIKMVITELGVMPPQSAPVIIRECQY